MFALGLLSWMYHRPTEAHGRGSSKTKFAKKPDIAAANIAAFQAGWNYGETDRGLRRLLRGRARPTAYPAAPTATSPATWRWPTA